MATSIQLEGKSGPSIQTFTDGSTFIECYGCYYNLSDSKYYSTDASSNVVTIKSTTDFRYKFYVSVPEGNELPATPASESIMNNTDFIVKSSGSNILQATTVGSGGGTEPPFPNGTFGTPSINFSSDTDTGFYRLSAGVFGLSLNGTKHLELNETTKWIGDNTASTDFAQFAIQGTTTPTKYFTFGLNTTANYGMIEAGNNGTSYYDLQINPQGGNILIGTDTNTYSTNLFINGSLGASSGFITRGTSLAFQFNGSATTGIKYDTSTVPSVLTSTIQFVRSGT